jgi:hypothetical protein
LLSCRLNEKQVCEKRRQKVESQKQDQKCCEIVLPEVVEKAAFAKIVLAKVVAKAAFGSTRLLTFCFLAAAALSKS